MTAGPLAGRVALVTGASRPEGIGAAVARRLLADDARVLVHGWPADDEAQPWGRREGFDAVLAALGGVSERVERVDADLADPAAPGVLVDAAQERFGALDIVVAAHARSSNQGLEALTVEELDLTWAVNARASVLLVKALA